MKYFQNTIRRGGRRQVNFRNVLLMFYFYFKKVKNKWKIKKRWINKKITSNTSFRLISFRRMNVFQTRWMMPAACCLKRKQSFSQKWELCTKHHFYLFCHYYFDGAQSKGFATLRNVSKLTFFDKIGYAKFCRFSVLFGYLTKWEPNLFEISRDHFDFFDLFFNFFEEECLTPLVVSVVTYP